MPKIPRFVSEYANYIRKSHGDHSGLSDKDKAYVRVMVSKTVNGCENGIYTVYDTMANLANIDSLARETERSAR